MLPNPKNIKNINNLLSNTSDLAANEAQVNQKKLQTKRKTIIFSLILTAGLSFIFWSYKAIQPIIKSPPRFNFNLNLKLPKFSFNQISKTKLSSYLEKSPINWSIFVSLDSDYSKPVFEHQSNLLKIDNDINLVVTRLNVIKFSSQSLVNSSLPQGLTFQEIVDNSNGVYYQGLINLPKNKILILIKNNNQINSSQVQTELSVLVDYLYWHTVGILD
jgi:hypothetical protein